MSFLFPLLGLAALGVGVPLWLHLRHRRPKNMLPFSTLRFLEDEPEPRKGSLRLRNPWLLAARALAVLLVALAFTWPYLEANPEGVTSSTVHLLDATLSRRADLQAEGDAFALDLARLQRTLATASPREQHAVVVLEGNPRIVASFGDGRETALRNLETLQASHQRGSYLDGLRLSQSLLDRSLGGRRSIRVYGDYQANQWSEHETSAPFLRDVKVILEGEAPPAPTRAPGAGSPAGIQAANGDDLVPNIALGAPQWRRFFVGDVTWVDLMLELYHQGPAESARVVVEVGGETLFDRQLDLRGAPSMITLQAQWKADPGRWQVGQVRAESEADVLAEDDLAHFSVPPVAEGKIELVALSPFLQVALSPEVMAGRWQTRQLDPADPEADRPVIELPDVLVLEASYLQAEGVRRLMGRQISNGKGVVLFVDRVTPLVKGALRPFGIEASAAPSSTAPSSTAPSSTAPSSTAPSSDEGTDPGSSGDLLRFVSSQHPIFRPFGERELGDLSQVSLFAHPELSSRRARPLIFGPQGEPALYQAPTKKGRLLVFGFGMQPEHTDWPLQPSYLPFLDLTLQYARAATPLQTAWQPGELFRFRPPREQAEVHANLANLSLYHLPAPGSVLAEDGAASDVGAGAEAVVPAAETPIKTPVEVAIDAPDMEVVDGELRFTLPDLPGVYRLADPRGGTVAMLAVDPSVEESHLEYDAEPTALLAWQLPSEPESDEDPALGSGSKPDAEGSGAGDAIFGSSASSPMANVPWTGGAAGLPDWILEQRWWWWALAVALVTLFVENLLLLSRRESS